MHSHRIAVAGFQHETNCYGVSPATLAEFEKADSWPEMLRGDAVLARTRGMNLPVAGFAAAAEAAGLEPVPLLWCSAEPSAHVTDDAFERICAELFERLERAGPVDGVYLDLHGAMVTQSFADGEGELLRRLRERVGPGVPLVASLDLHANLSAAMVEHSDYLAIFRSYPHLDMAETGARCVPVLQFLLAGGALHKTREPVPFLVPLHAQHTGAAPFDALYGLLPPLDAEGVHADIALGFTAADFPDTGPACVAYAREPDSAARAAQTLRQRFVEAETRIDDRLLSPEQAAAATQHEHPAPLLLADVQDNAGAGGTSDTTGLLHALVSGGATGVLMGLFHDAETAAQAHAAGVGGRFVAALGAKSGLPGQRPLRAEFEVLALSDGLCRYTGEMYGGGLCTLGDTAALRLRGEAAEIDIVVTSERIQCVDLAQFEHLGLDPRRYRVVCVKSTVHYLADFAPIASAVHSVAAPGAFACRLAEVPYTNLGTRRLLARRGAQSDGA